LAQAKGDPGEDRKLWRGIISAETTAGNWRQRMNLIAQIEAEQIAALGKTIPDFKAGDTIRVGYKVTEGSRSRVQAYEGVCIGRKGGTTIAASFTVRKISFGEGVERVFPLYSTNIDSIDVVRRGKVRRAKLYYLRTRRGKSARIAEDSTYKAKAE
jgi:large subunit ribosomal protein L19